MILRGFLDGDGVGEGEGEGDGEGRGEEGGVGSIDPVP